MQNWSPFREQKQKNWSIVWRVCSRFGGDCSRGTEPGNLREPLCHCWTTAHLFIATTAQKEEEKTHKICLHHADKIQLTSTPIHSILTDTITHTHTLLCCLLLVFKMGFTAVGLSSRSRQRLSFRMMEKYSFHSLISLLIFCLTPDYQDLRV